MSDVDSDLEEGEILDDSPSTLSVSKNKELPRRYILRENKDIHQKHKKDCKYAIRHHAKKLAKLKKTPIKPKEVHKPYKPCPHMKSQKLNKKSNFNVFPPKRLISKNSHLRSVSEKNGPFEDINKFGPRTSRSQPENFQSKPDIAKTIESCSFAEMLAMYKSIRSQRSESSLCNSREINDNIAKNSEGNVEESCNGVATKSQEGMPDHCVEQICEIIEIIDSSCDMAPKSQEDQKEDSDDEEELRRIALATCAKENVTTEQPAVNLTSNIPVSTIPEFLNGVSCVSNCIDIPAVDNYEVVDMDVDEENENSTDTTNNLFVIDTKPFLDLRENSNSASREQTASSDEDFEADILRAELIESMYRQKSTADEMISENKELKLDNLQDPLPNSDKQIVPENSNSRFVRTLPEMKNKSKRLIISLNAESSSDESDEDDPIPPNTLPENPVASIEALISDIRQKSDDKGSDGIEAVPEAVASLSKAQQEEYISYMKILAKKKIPQETMEAKNKIVSSPLDDLKLLEKKMLEVSEALKKKKELMTSLTKEVTAKKFMYMKSKLTAQHLKEQYVAAEKVRRLKLDAWSKSCKNFEALKKSVSDLESKTTHLQSLCSKVGSTIEGQNYSLPSVSIES